MAGTGSAETQAFRDEFTDELIKKWPDDTPPDQDTLRWAIAEVTKTWTVTYARFGFKDGPMRRMMVQTPWALENGGSKHV